MLDNCIILTTDEIDLVSTLDNYKNFDYIVCEKGALYSTYNVLNVVKVIGDLDSLNEYDKNRVLLCYPNINIASKNKDETDGELALNWAINKKYKNIYIMSTGIRFDHAINHFFLLNKHNKHNIYIFDKYNWTFILKKGDNFIFNHAINVSFFTFSKDILNSQNLTYKLINAPITANDNKFISNSIVDFNKPTIVNSKNGKAFCIVNIYDDKEK